MTGSYSTDLRSRVLTAMEAGESPAAAAKRWAVVFRRVLHVTGRPEAGRQPAKAAA